MIPSINLSVRRSVTSVRQNTAEYRRRDEMQTVYLKFLQRSMRSLNPVPSKRQYGSTGVLRRLYYVAASTLRLSRPERTTPVRPFGQTV